ncbi:hypothetical protein C8A05DRAFT_12688 [Staphylotrichum tortipilum]|uniref:Uncharacterized protein n=1 Tax=Staphylotrichum tortipilum TaxID=2831512 RepID=A0AAN6RWN4_9PEZI|nr:hypothetical protein C8A05DRAFT_12688 [Staphylotrichum longicolle]
MVELVDVLPEAALFSVVRPHPSKTNIMIKSPVVDGLAGRSSSLNLPLAKKASFRLRGWVKRSSSSRTAGASGLSASEAFKTQIKHLGGGRLGREAVAENPSGNLTLQSPAPKGDQRSRAGSTDSRVTQWLDFYTGPSELVKSQRPPLPLPPSAAQAPGRDQRPGSRVDLRPAPLRTPSSERRASPGAPPATLTRENSTSKPLPHLPSQAVESENSDLNKASAVAEAKAESLGREPESATCSRADGKRNSSSEEGVRELLPPLGLAAPPGAGNAVGDSTPRRAEDGCEDENKPLPPEPELPNAIPREQPSGSKAEAGAPITLTRRERIWLHVNYRGEGPFLRAWGLDITKPVDRSEGLALLRDLIQAECEGKAMESSRPLAKC